MVMQRMHLITGAAVALGLAVAALPAAAQRPAQPMPPPHPAPPAQPAARPQPPEHPAPPTEAERAENTRSFRGIASKLNTTPDALEQAYLAAKQADPKLTRGQFIAANVLAQNLGTAHPAITTQAILDGLKSGKSIGQTLQSLGLSEQEANQAEHAADREVKEADRAANAREGRRDSTR